MSSYCYFNGRVIPFSEAHIRPDDLGILRGFAVYEGITAVNGIPFHYNLHHKRLLASAHAVGLIVPFSEEEVESGLCELLKREASIGRASIRLILSGGAALGGIEYDPSHTLLYALAEQATQCPEEWYTHGASLITHEHERFMPEYKTTAYITAVMLQKVRKEKGAAEILYTYEDKILECSTSNIFLVHGTVISTPKAGVLPGITREIAITLLENKYTIEERDIATEELYTADEIFMTSSFKDIVPVVVIDGVSVGGGVPGPITQELMREYQNALMRGQ